MMWELIAANRRKSIALFAGMMATLCALGYFIGHVVIPDGGGYVGLIFALAIWAVLSSISVFGGGSMILSMSGAREVKRDFDPRLYNVVEEMKIASGLDAMPKIYVIDDKAPNAFATGIKPENSAVAVTAGLLTTLNRDELQGVIAHEMSHIINRDVQFMTVASIMLGSIVLLSQVFLRGMWFSGGGSSRRYRSGKGGGGGHPAFIIVAIALAILGPIFARLLYFAISRKREYLADASAARLTRYPEGLASALEKISQSPLELAAANKVTAPMYIVNPLAVKGMKASGMGSTHPPAAERIRILREMGGGAFLDYQRAFSKVKGKPSMIIPTSGLRKDEPVRIRDAHPDVAGEDTALHRAHETLDMMRAANGFLFLICACGLKLKIPPDFEDDHVACPRCKKDNVVPRAAMSEMMQSAAVVGAMAGAIAGGDAGGAGAIPSAQPSTAAPDPGAPDAPLEYRRRTDGWESFACGCGHLMQLSPAFDSRQMKCPKCNRITRIH